MPKQKDENETAFDAIQEIIRRDQKRDGLPYEPIPEEKLPYRVDAGRKGGRKGGVIRNKRLSAEKKKEIARKAAKARWKKT